MLVPGSPKSIITHLYDAYVDDLKERDKKRKSLTEFLEFAEAYLTANPAINPCYLEQGLGVTLKNNQVVCIGPTPPPVPTMHDGGIQLRKHNYSGSMLPDTSIAVTQGR